MRRFKNSISYRTQTRCSDLKAHSRRRFVRSPSHTLYTRFKMRVALFLTVLSAIVGFVAAASPAAYAARGVPSGTPPSRRAPTPSGIGRRAPGPSGIPRREPKPSGIVRRAPGPSGIPRRAPAPSGSPERKRTAPREMKEQTAMVSLDSILCPYRMSACPVNPTSTIPKSLAEWAEIEHECVEFATDLQSCGGCASIDERYAASLFLTLCPER